MSGGSNGTGRRRRLLAAVVLGVGGVVAVALAGDARGLSDTVVSASALVVGVVAAFGIRERFGG